MNPLFPSILSTNFFDLHDKLAALKKSGIDFIHLDVMDGHFVNNISFGPATIAAVRSRFDFKFDTHLMVDCPEKVIPWYIQAGSDWISFHIEAEKNPQKLIDLLHSRNVKAGIVLNPDTPVERVFSYINHLDYILLMSVFPGYGGQSFIPETMDRIRSLKDMIVKSGSACLIQVDGGIKADMAGALKSAGADLLVMGTALYNSDHIPGVIEKVTEAFNGE